MLIVAALKKLDKEEVLRKHQRFRRPLQVRTTWPGREKAHPREDDVVIF